MIYYKSVVIMELDCIYDSEIISYESPLEVEETCDDVIIKCHKCGKIYSLNNANKIPVNINNNFNENFRTLNNILFIDTRELDTKMAEPVIIYLNNYCRENKISSTEVILNGLRSILPDNLGDLIGDDIYKKFCDLILENIKKEILNKGKNFVLYLFSKFLNVTSKEFARNLFYLLHGYIGGLDSYCNNFITFLTLKESYIDDLKNKIKSDKDIRTYYDDNLKQIESSLHTSNSFNNK